MGANHHFNRAEQNMTAVQMHEFIPTGRKSLCGSSPNLLRKQRLYLEFGVLEGRYKGKSGKA